MAKKKSDKRGILFVCLIILAAILVIASPFLLVAVLATAFPSVDGYLLTGFSFCIFGFVLILGGALAVLAIFKSDVPKNNKLDYFKRVYQQYKQFILYFLLPGFLLFLLLEAGIAYRGNTYLKDIMQGPQVAIMKDAVVDSSGRGNSTYLVGYVNGEKLHLKITRDARSDVSRGGSYKMLWIEYYEGIQEVYDIAIFMK